MVKSANAWAAVISLLTSTFFISDGSSPHESRINLKVCKDKTDGFHMYDGDCKKYIWCLNGRGYVLLCPFGLHYNPEEMICTPLTASNCAYFHPVNSLYNDEREFRSVFPRNIECARIVCYFPNDSARNRHGNGKYSPRNINAFLCTHIIYSYANLINNRLVFESEDDDELVRKVMEKKVSNPNLKVLLSVGGWSMGSAPFSEMVATASTRATFILSAIELLRKNDFDGLELHWLFPAYRGSPRRDKQRFTDLLKELRAAFDDEEVPAGKSKLLLTAAVSAIDYKVDRAYEVKEIDLVLDFFSLLTYNYHGHWDMRTGHNSPYSKVRQSAEYWVKKGASRNKIVIGLPFFGRSFTLIDENDDEYWARAEKGMTGQYTNIPGVLSFYEVCILKDKRGATLHLHEHVDPHVVYKDQWVGYDDRVSMWTKVEFIRSERFGGAMVWDLSMDDFCGTFCGYGIYPLLTEIYRACKA